MSFLDSKEQVIDLVLSKYGREQISQGLFAPVYYGFLDDDVIYNAEKMGVAETQNTSETRIVEETPKNSFITNIAGLNINKFKALSTKPEEKDLFQNSFGLSNSELGSQEAPRFNYICLRNALSSSSDIKTIENFSYQLPQLNFDLNTFIVLDEATQNQKELFSEEAALPKYDGGKQEVAYIFNQGEMVSVIKGETIGLMLENNSSKVNDTFELEFYLCEKFKETNAATQESTTKTKLTQLDPFAPPEEENSLIYYLDVRTEKDIQIVAVNGFSLGVGLYDNLPQVIEDFC